MNRRQQLVMQAVGLFVLIAGLAIISPIVALVVGGAMLILAAEVLPDLFKRRDGGDGPK